MTVDSRCRDRLDERQRCLPDEKGIETLRDMATSCDHPTLRQRCLPDEKGIETRTFETTATALASGGSAASPMRRGLKRRD